jgi:hypothetical protein
VTIEEEVYDLLTSATEHVYPNAVPPQAMYPATVYQRISTGRDRSHDGTAGVRPLFQFTSWDRSVAVARQTGRSIVDVMEPLGNQTLIEGHRETYDPENKLHGVIVEVRLVRNEESL